MHDGSSDQMLRYFSRVALIVPIIVIVVGLFLFEFQKNYKNDLTAKSMEKNSIPSPVANPTASPNKNAFNINGSYLCNTNSQEASTSAYYKQKKLFVKSSHKKTKETTYTLYTKGCLYLWGSGSFSGQKVCGLETYESFIGSAMSMNILSPDTIISSLLSSLNTASSTNSANKIQSVVDSCRPDTKFSESVFNLPQNILFKNSTLDQLK